jgi:hypothetical protein
MSAYEQQFVTSEDPAKVVAENPNGLRSAV